MPAGTGYYASRWRVGFSGGSTASSAAGVYFNGLATAQLHTDLGIKQTGLTAWEIWYIGLRKDLTSIHSIQPTCLMQYRTK